MKKQILNTHFINDTTDNDNLPDFIDLLIVLNKSKDIKLFNLPLNLKYIVLKTEVDEQNIKVPFGCEMQVFTEQEYKFIKYVFELPKRYKLQFLQEDFEEFINMKIIKIKGKFWYDLNFNGRGFIYYSINYNCADKLLSNKKLRENLLYKKY